MGAKQHQFWLEWGAFQNKYPIVTSVFLILAGYGAGTALWKIVGLV